MRVPRFWVKQTSVETAVDGRRFEAGCWGWSESSEDEARNRALVSAKRLAARFAKGDDPPNHYGYDERLPREEIIDEMSDGAGEVHAFVTRNSHGAVILNTRDLAFIDVDLPPEGTGIKLPRFIAQILGDRQHKIGQRWWVIEYDTSRTNSEDSDSASIERTTDFESLFLIGRYKPNPSNHENSWKPLTPTRFIAECARTKVAFARD